MIPKPEIQYVGQFYIHGSEAKKLEPKKEPRKAKTRLPLERLRKIEKVYLDPVAICAITVSLVMVAAMAVGALRLREDWKQYRAVSSYVSELNRENFRLTRKFQASYDLEDIRAKALGLGLIPEDEAAVRFVTVTVPEPEPESSWLDELKWFWNGLWE